MIPFSKIWQKLLIWKIFRRKSIEDKVILTGGDGTLNHFVNEIGNLDIKCEIDYCPSGSGNDFYTDVANFEDSRAVRINEFIKDLPILTVKGKDYRFINGVGFGIDGYCCEKVMKFKEHQLKMLIMLLLPLKEC